MAFLNPDSIFNFGGITVKEYLFTKHNPNRISMPSYNLPSKVLGITIHNTGWISVASGTTPAEQYTRATVNGNMKDVRVHYSVDNTCAWQNLPLTLSGWHAADGNGNGNRGTIAIECIMSPAYNSADKKSEDNCARLAAALLKKYGLDINHLYTHTHWLNVRDGKKGTVDQLNTMHNNYKMCPAYILPHWATFKAKVQSYMNSSTTASNTATSTKNNSSSNASSKTNTIYRVRKTWNNSMSQLGAFSSLENAKKACKSGYSVFDSYGNKVYPVETAKSNKWTKGQKVTIRANTPLFANDSTTKMTKRISGTYYIYDGKQCGLGRYRITTKAEYCGKSPAGNYVTGFVSYDNFS